ncbi:MAG: response regulator [Pseudomonadota bacterium]
MSQRVALVEDEPHIVELLRFVLSRAGFNVTDYANGHIALEAMRQSPPDVLVLDRMLPGLDGLEVLRAIRSDNTLASLPVLMLTAKGQSEARTAALAAGANVFITKPFANTELVSAVRQLAKTADDTGRAS